MRAHLKERVVYENRYTHIRKMTCDMKANDVLVTQRTLRNTHKPPEAVGEERNRSVLIVLRRNKHELPASIW